MSAFLDNISYFTGTGERNEQGFTLEEFLEKYDPNAYPNPSVTADILVFQHRKHPIDAMSQWKLLMIKRRNHPSIGHYALPGGFVDIREDIQEAAKRELEEETGLTDIPMEQLYCFGKHNRDPRTRIITVAYLAFIEEELMVKAGDDAAEAVWMNVTWENLNQAREADGRKFEDYRIQLVSEDQKIHLSADVEYSKNIQGLIKEEDFCVIQTDKIAFDHPCFILKALLYLQDKV